MKDLNEYRLQKLEERMDKLDEVSSKLDKLLGQLNERETNRQRLWEISKLTFVAFCGAVVGAVAKFLFDYLNSHISLVMK